MLSSGCNSGAGACHRVLDGPLQGVVGDLFPTFSSDDAVVRTPFELLVVGGALRVAVVLDVGLVDRRWHDVVLAPPYKQQRWPILISEVHVGFLVARGKVGRSPYPHQPARGGDVVTLISRVGLFPREVVGEGVVPLLGGKAHGLVAVGRILQNREERADL